MTQTTVPTARVRARVLAFVVAGMAALSLAYACAQTQRSLGDECIKSVDCLSGICSQFVCTAAPPLTSSMADNTDASESDTGSGADSTGSEAAPDTGSGDETGTEAGSEGGDGATEASSGD
jgi:hypothetical protein